MRITLLTNEYPPLIYGGAGVHVEYLSRELSLLDLGRHKIQILCFGNQKEDAENMTVEGIKAPFDFSIQRLRHPKLLDTLLRNIFMTGMAGETDLVHCHTWYTYLAGCLIKQILTIPLVITTHSLEPHRPWKAEQLGSAYKATLWLEKTAFKEADGVIAVSQSMATDVHRFYQVPFEKIRIIPNGIDTNEYRPGFNPSLLTSYLIDPDLPYILFVGRITRQKGLVYLIDAIKYLAPGVQIVLCAGAPDTEEIGREMEEKIEIARSQTSNQIIWIRQMLTREHLIPLFSHASVFVCPSIYEPFGIVNLEAMACGTPVVAAAIGGIPEVVIHGENGLLVPFEPADNDSNAGPKDPTKFSRDLAEAVNKLLASPDETREMGRQSMERVVVHFSWKSIARQTLEFYQNLIRKG